MKKDNIKFEIPQTTLDTWQGIVDVVAGIIDIPAALIMQLTDNELGVLVASKSVGNPYHLGHKQDCWGSGLYCETVLKTQKKLLVANALKDELWKHNPDTKLGMISYLGFPIMNPDGSMFGTICVLDRKENKYSKLVENLMYKFITIIQNDLEIIKFNQVLGDENKRLIDYLSELQVLRGLVHICAWCKSIKDDQNDWHPVEYFLTKNPEMDFTHGICPNCAKIMNPDF